MKKYVSSILVTVSALIVILNVYIFSTVLIRTNEGEYIKTNYLSYVSDVVMNVEKDNIIANVDVKKKDNIEYKVLDTFIGSITGYGPDCYGCGGKTSFGHDLRNGNIYYQDNTFGSLRILAADKQYPFGTVFRVSGLKVYNEPFLAIVLDRGGAIIGTKMDLAFESESDPLVKQIGFSKDIQYEVLRYGW